MHDSCIDNELVLLWDFQYFQREIRERYENDHELLFAVAGQITLNAKKMKRLEKDYLAKRTKEQEEAIELRVSFDFDPLFLSE